MATISIEHSNPLATQKDLAWGIESINRTSPESDQAVTSLLEEMAAATGLPSFVWIPCRRYWKSETSIPSWLTLSPALVDRFLYANGSTLVDLGPSIRFIGFPVTLPTGEVAILGSVAREGAANAPAEWIMAATDAGWSQAELTQFVDSLLCIPRPTLERLCALAGRHFSSMRTVDRLDDELQQLTSQIEYTFEEISLLHSLTQRLQLSRSPLELANHCLARLHSLIPAAGNAIWMQVDHDRHHFSVEGHLPLDEFQLARLTSRFEEHDWSRPLVKNNLAKTLLGADFPGLQNFILVPIGEAPFRRGWIVSCNLSDDKEYGSVEASLLGSIGTILGTHLRNIELYREHQSLVISFVRSLVQTLDAKDPYTRGHSERVALIARRLGQELRLPADDLEDIYMSSMLHDIGKIGVDDRILRKPDQLTPEEFRAIQQHPMIGYRILKQLKNLQHILPGVRSHHEAFNGKGYPDCLKGEEIPLMARIIAVADSYDAMCSDRPYRKGMPLERLEEIFRRGSGLQWDPNVIDAYFAAREDISEICRAYSPTGADLLAELPIETMARRFL
ncbi:metal-dependent phosphohydrolase HD sub domain protein [Planctopirus limnophila DSM 3776]|uniref:Metal-dependent phosphohydrolase HD sub domain protein n=1 Tax=Planctopirus limnophila (strain ATCC 43296 / DSM 3776 / IFAM 1008 / Mu 290) TaxID=521674 RepID=D5SWQ8_PLAL2|nr:HD-GYP domain-containing protein [Planctopirus limnophila]ADG67408.1 metal-dependent phosphohydrolase HD sub domain protein [Planctopirus limnophila DSM 3776]